MTTFQQYQQQLAANLKAVIGISQASIPSANEDLNPLLVALIDAWPYYGNPDWDACHRGALCNLLQTNLPNNLITAEPYTLLGYSGYYLYAYSGPFSGYRDAFFHGVGLTVPASKVSSLVQGVNGNLNSTWWGNYAITALTDAVRLKLPISLNTAKLTADLASYNSGLSPALTASYLAIFQTGFNPTATALNAIVAAGQGQAANVLLSSAIKAGQFTANINQCIAMGGESADAAVWFLFNLWVTLKALGSADVDTTIQQAQTSGLTVPNEVGPGNWWNGGYASWYIPLSGSDLVGIASSTITATMPETSSYISEGYLISTDNTSVANGFAQSLCTWGALNVYLPPPPDSCFGKGTGVLMADGSVKPIETIQLGDTVLSSLGPRKVVLIETPKRGGRHLFQINSQQLFATSAHPFRSARGKGPLRLAIDAWALFEGIPTMIADGIGLLQEGVELAGWANGTHQNVKLAQLATHEANSVDECVYDLLLEDWTKDHPSYFVGGPDTFFAVDSETADPMHNIPGTAAILTALQAVLPISRQFLTEPNAQLPHLLASLKLDDLRSLAHAAESTQTNGKPKLPPMPDPTEFYRLNGAWDPHASALEFHLVKQFAPSLRREAAMGWRLPNVIPTQNAHFTVCVHDLLLLGEAAIPANTPVEIKLTLRGWSDSGDLVKTVAVDACPSPRWLLLVDHVLEFGRFQSPAPSGSLIGTIAIGDAILGQFRTVTTETLQASAVEHVIFDGAGQIVGRIGMEQRQLSADDFVEECKLATQWTGRHAAVMGISLGQSIGQKLATLIKAKHTTQAK